MKGIIYSSKRQDYVPGPLDFYQEFATDERPVFKRITADEKYIYFYLVKLSISKSIYRLNTTTNTIEILATFPNNVTIIDISQD
jgi:hypothetical protein